MWTVIADQGTSGQLAARARSGSWRSEAGCYLVTFTRYLETVEDLVRDTVRLAGLPVDEETVKRTLNQLFELSGETVLNLAKVRPNVASVESNVAKSLAPAACGAPRWMPALLSASPRRAGARPRGNRNRESACNKVDGHRGMTSVAGPLPIFQPAGTRAHKSSLHIAAVPTT